MSLLPLTKEQKRKIEEEDEDKERKFCHKCGEKIFKEAEICPKCGVRQSPLVTKSNKSKVVAGLLALFLGALGIHEFYLGHSGKGILILLLSLFLGIPLLFAFGIGLLIMIPIWVIAFIQGIHYLAMSEENFNAKYNK